MTVSVTVWPGLDANGNSLTVYAEDGETLIPAVGGALVPYTMLNGQGVEVPNPYYPPLIASGQLVTKDPLEGGGVPVTLVAPVVTVSDAAEPGQTLVAVDATTAEWRTPTSGSVQGTLVASLSARIGSAANEIVGTTGWSSDNDGRSGSYEWGAGDFAAADGKVRIAVPGHGTWRRRVKNKRAIDLAEDFGIREGASDNGPAINEAAAFANANGIHSLCLPAGDWPVTTQIRLNGAQFTFFGEGPDSRLIWNATSGFCLYAGSGAVTTPTRDSHRLANFQIYVATYNAGDPDNIGAVRIQGFTRGQINNLKLMTNLGASALVPYGTAILHANGTWVNTISGGLTQGFAKGIHFCKLNGDDVIDATLNWGAYNSNLIQGWTATWGKNGIVIGDPAAGENTLYLGAGLKIKDCALEDQHEGAIWIASGYGVQVKDCYFESNSAFNVRIGSAAHAPGTLIPRGTVVEGCTIFDCSTAHVGVDVVQSALARIERNYFYGLTDGVCVRLSANDETVNASADGTRIWDNYPAAGLDEILGQGVNTDPRHSATGGSVTTHMRKDIDTQLQHVLEGRDVRVSGGVTGSPIEVLRAFYDSDTGGGVTSSPVEIQRYLTVTSPGSGAGPAAEYRQLVTNGGGLIQHRFAGDNFGGVEMVGRPIASVSTQNGHSPAVAVLSRAMVARINSAVAGAVRAIAATPSIVAGQRDGQELTVENNVNPATPNADTWRLQSNATLPGSTLRLTAATIDLAPLQSVKFRWNATLSQWIQCGPVVAVI